MHATVSKAVSTSWIMACVATTTLTRVGTWTVVVASMSPTGMGIHAFQVGLPVNIEMEIHASSRNCRPKRDRDIAETAVDASAQ